MFRFLASNISTNIRDLEGALNQLNAFCEAHEIPLATLQITQNIFQQHYQKKKIKKPTPKQILDKVASYYQLSVDDLKSPKRNQEIVLPRQIAMYLLRNELSLSLPKVAQKLNRRDHTTALHSVNKIEKELTYNEELKNNLKELKNNLKLTTRV